MVCILSARLPAHLLVRARGRADGRAGELISPSPQLIIEHIFPITPPTDDYL